MATTNFFTIITVSNSEFDGYVDWAFKSVGILFSLETGFDGDKVEYSFDGINTHGTMRYNFSTEALAFDNRPEQRVYFRKTGGVSAGVDVRIETWK